jgi:hypothetical protein
MLVAKARWLGEGSTVVANAERAKDAAEAYSSGDPLVYDLKGRQPHGGRDGITVVAAPSEVAGGHCRLAFVPVTALIGAPTNNGGRHEHHRRARQRDSTVPRRYSR